MTMAGKARRRGPVVNEYREQWEKEMGMTLRRKIGAIIDPQAFQTILPASSYDALRKADAILALLQPTPEMIDAALNAWFKSPPSETDQGLERSMRAALIAAFSDSSGDRK